MKFMIAVTFALLSSMAQAAEIKYVCVSLTDKGDTFVLFLQRNLFQVQTNDTPESVNQRIKIIEAGRPVLIPVMNYGTVPMRFDTGHMMTYPPQDAYDFINGTFKDSRSPIEWRVELTQLFPGPMRGTITGMGIYSRTNTTKSSTSFFNSTVECSKIVE